MKERYEAVLVVEGTSDAALISSFLEADIVITNGSEVSRETLDYIKKLSEYRTIVVLTDPDAPGKRIRDLISQQIPSVLHAFIKKEDAIKHHKVGVAESSPAVIKEALSHLVPNVPAPDSDLSYEDLFDLHLVGCDEATLARRKITDYYHLGYVNGKTLLKRLRALGLSRTDLEEVLHERG